MNMKKTVISALGATALLLALITASGCGEWEQIMKNKGLETKTNVGEAQIGKVTIYDDSGHVLKQYEGQASVQASQAGGGTITVNLDGKQVSLYNVREIVEEK